MGGLSRRSDAQLADLLGPYLEMFGRSTALETTLSPTEVTLIDGEGDDLHEDSTVAMSV